GRVQNRRVNRLAAGICEFDGFVNMSESRGRGAYGYLYTVVCVEVGGVQVGVSPVVVMPPDVAHFDLRGRWVSGVVGQHATLEKLHEHHLWLACDAGSQPVW